MYAHTSRFILSTHGNPGTNRNNEPAGTERLEIHGCIISLHEICRDVAFKYMCAVVRERIFDE